MKHAAFLFCLSALLFASGCYHFGTPYGEVPGSIGEVSIANQTDEPAVFSYVMHSLRERASVDSGFTLKDTFPQFDFDIVLKEIQRSSAISAETRDKSVRNSRANAYQTVVFRATLVAHVRVTKLGEDKPCIDADYQAYGDIPRMHDDDIPRQAALKQASKQLVDKLLNDLAMICEE